MTDLMSREKEFLKLNEELNIKTNIVLDKPKNDSKNNSLQSHNTSYTEGNITNRSEMQSRRSSITSNSTKITQLTENSISGRTTPSKESNYGKFSIKPRPFKANTVPRNSREFSNPLARKTVKEKELLRLNAQIDKKAKLALDDISENKVLENEEKPTSRRTTRVTTTPAKSQKMPTSSQKISQNCLIETYKNANFCESPSTEVLNDESNENSFETDTRRSTIKTEVDSTTTISTERRFSQRSHQVVYEKPPLPKKNLSSDGLIKFLKSKVTILQDELESTSNDLTKRVEEFEIILEHQKKLENQRDLAISKNNNLTAQLSKMEEKLTTAERKLKERDIEFTGINRELENLKREMRLLTQSNTNLEKRLYRANEEIENMKNNMTSLRDSERELKEAQRQEKDGFERQIKLLRKQRTEMLTAYKKQLYLLDNLKRQTNCLEQARLIAFAEKEFTKVLEWNTNA